ncbi:unnamed protein product [Amoebophrya sp. A120]|nr:unnamed protein product [Amoebophrya sp. A120]|eukprot:GSA120T00025076001.1
MFYCHPFRCFERMLGYRLTALQAEVNELQAAQRASSSGGKERSSRDQQETTALTTAPGSDDDGGTWTDEEAGFDSVSKDSRKGRAADRARRPTPKAKTQAAPDDFAELGIEAQYSGVRTLSADQQKERQENWEALNALETEGTKGEVDHTARLQMRSELFQI